MRTWHPLILIVALAACSGGTKDTPADGSTIPDGGGDADTDADSDSDTDVPCDATILLVTPLDGDDLVPLDAVVTATFDVPITEAQPHSITVGTAPGTTTLATDGLSMTWVGDPLEPLTDYDITASVCDNTSTSSITTLPAPLDLSSLAGNTYVLLWDDLRISQPQNDVALNAFIDVPFVLAQVLAVDEVTLLADAVGTTGDDDGFGNPVPVCDVATLQTADFTLNPYFRIEGTIAIPVDPANGVYTDVEDFSLLAKMEADGQSITDIRLSGLIATEDIVPDNDCATGPLIAFLNPLCLPCTASATGQCMLFEATALRAALDPAIDLATECGL